MNDIRARYIQDEREDARKEGIKEGEIKGKIKGKIEGKMEERKQVITNMLKETDDINFIHKMTKYPRSEIINCFRIKPIIKLSIIEYISKNFVIKTNFLYSI